MTQKMTEENKPFVMATLSGVAYKDPEEASKTFEHFRFTEHKYIDRDGAQCYLIWNDDDAVVIFRGTEPKQWSDVKADLNAFKRRGRYKHGYVHGGFQGELDKIWDELDTELSVLEDRNIHVTGHSLGGAMATQLQREYQKNMITCIVYTLLVHPELQIDNGVSHLKFHTIVFRIIMMWSVKFHFG